MWVHSLPDTLTWLFFAVATRMEKVMAGIVSRQPVTAERGNRDELRALFGKQKFY